MTRASEFPAEVLMHRVRSFLVIKFQCDKCASISPNNCHHDPAIDMRNVITNDMDSVSDNRTKQNNARSNIERTWQKSASDRPQANCLQPEASVSQFQSPRKKRSVQSCSGRCCFGLYIGKENKSSSDKCFCPKTIHFLSRTDIRVR